MFYILTFVYERLPTYMHVHHTSVWRSKKPEVGTGFPKMEFQIVVATWVLSTKPGTCGIALLLLTADPFLHSKPYLIHPQSQGTNPKCLNLIAEINGHSYDMF